MGSMTVLSRFVSQASPVRGLLAAAQNVPNQTFTIEQALRGRGELRLKCPRDFCRGGFQACIDEREACTNPVAVTAVD